MNLILGLVIHLIIGISFAVNVNGLKCYVCGDGEEIPCENFETSNDNYTKECKPPSNVSCKTEAKKGKIITRTCYSLYFNECYAANEVDYCFCSTDLCNSSVHTHKFISPTDDEDLLEGSGTKIIPTVTEKPNVPIKGNSTGIEVRVSQTIFFMSFIVLFITQ